MKHDSYRQVIREFHDMGESWPRATRSAAADIVPRLGWQLMDAAGVLHRLGNRLAGQPCYQSFEAAWLEGASIERASYERTAQR